MDRRRDVLKFARNANRIAQVSTILPVNMDRIVLLEYVASADDVHKKYFHRRQPPTAAGLPAKLNSAQLRRQAGGQRLG